MKYKHIITISFLLLFEVMAFGQNRNEYSKLIQDGWKLCLNDENGWPDKKKIGKRGTSTLFLVIQHANQETQEKYLSMIKKAVADNNLPKVSKNKQAIEKYFDKDLVADLDKIYFDDQSTRNQIMIKEKKYGRGSKEMDAFWQVILKKDSINLIKVSKILDENGWPDKKKIGKRGISTLFLVIQHANQETQEKYLSMIKKAVTDNNLPKRQFAMFYDRLILRRGEKQVYGTQLAMNDESKAPYVLPLEDPRNVDKRRAEMGLNTMQENLNRWNLVWDVEAYIKVLPTIEAKEKELNEKNKKQ